MRAEAETQTAVAAIKDAIREGYAAKDLDSLMALFAPDPDVVVVGTGSDERRVGFDAIRNLIRRDLEQAEAILFEWGWETVSQAGAVAWLTLEPFVYVRVDGVESVLPIRFSLVLEHRGEHWLVVHWHTSIPATDQAIGESIPHVH